jgi:hypothetical protein
VYTASGRREDFQNRLRVLLHDLRYRPVAFDQERPGR